MSGANTTRPTTEAMVRDAARKLGLQAAGMVAIVVLAVVGLAALITIRQESANTHILLSAAASTADDVTDPPAGMWLAMRDPTGAVQATRNTPAGLPEMDRLSAVEHGAAATSSELDLPSGRFLVYTVRAPDGRVVQAILDLGPWQTQRDSLLNGLLATALIGLVLAAVVGVFLARRALTPLQRTFRLQRQFIADASHELRTPLTLLHTRVQLLDRGLHGETVDADTRREVAAVVQDSSRLTELLEDLLLAADGETSGQADVEVGPLMAEVAAAATPYATERGVRLVHEPSDATARASAPAVRRALTALVDNAIEHTPPVGSVTISSQNTSSLVTLRVHDTGTGISPDDAAAHIARFHSGGRRAGRRHYGLGLALVSDIADRYGGRLDIDSRPGRGATVSLSLPTGAASPATGSQPAARSKHP